jgi:hypothetical protein
MAEGVTLKVYVHTDEKYRAIVRDHIRMTLTEEFECRVEVEDE